MAPLDVLLDNTVSACSHRDARLTLTVRIDIALTEVERAHATVKAANRSPVKQALKLFRSRPSAKLKEVNSVREDGDGAAVALAQDISSGERALLSLQPTELLLLQRALQTRRNSLAPISRLPTEVLAPILEQCPTIGDDAPSFRTANFVAGLQSAHVCRRWRDIALDSARFWAHIVLSRPRWALEMLHRSRAAPLVVGLNLVPAPTKTVAARDLVLAQLARIRELHLNKSADHIIPQELLLPAPILDTFRLEYDAPNGGIKTVPPTLFQGQAPALRHLALRCCILHSESPLWNNLVSLELVKAPIDSLPSFLARMPHLRILTLSDSSPTELEEEGAAPVPLELEELTLRGSSWRCYCFLRTVLLPACRMRVYVPYTTSDLRFVWDAVEGQRACADEVFCGLKLADSLRGAEVSDTGTPDTARFEVALFGHSDPVQPRYSVLLDLEPPLLPNWREETIYNAMVIVSLEQVNALTIESAGLNLSAPLLTLKHLRRAAFHGRAAPFTAPLARDPLMRAGGPAYFDPLEAAVYYPRLRWLTFHHVDFKQQAVTEAMLDWLAQRRRLNLGIEELLLVGCTLSTADMGALGEVVSHVYTEDG
ncbi:hypothetical protein B0H15DRAFT_832656 [Mycena belliarum]|uniref:F-box domain-containing protein n=1 Tax=Mycena belliarum TaxID=1033014 RepID=A0AAD6U9G3_9AGAR|nr:hypothetical protein B0H15DRAFT_832656 [Mycena belliae]